MVKISYYQYLGKNGLLTTPIKLEGIYSVEKIYLAADNGKLLTKDNQNFVESVTVTPEDVELWSEV